MSTSDRAVHATTAASVPVEIRHTPAWYRAARFGIFIHWGVYAVPAFNNEWYPRNMYQLGSAEWQHHRATYGPQHVFGYKDFIPRFHGEHFAAPVWARLFRRAGARYIVAVAEHHDGFAMYDCATSRWNAVRMGPKRDVIGELAQAIREAGLAFGLSYHRAEHWWFFNGGRHFASDVTDPTYADLYGPAAPQDEPPAPWFLADWQARVCELIERYRPQLLYFDSGAAHPVFAPYVRSSAAFYYQRAREWGIEVVINSKEGTLPSEWAVPDVERGGFAMIQPHLWQADTTIAHSSWCYVANQSYKSAETLIHRLIDTVSKNGCLLLNVGPQPDGRISAAETAVLEAMGDWLAVHGEAIYDTRPWHTFGEGPTPSSDGAFSEHQQPAFCGADLRFTTRGDTLYLLCLGEPERELRVTALGRRQVGPIHHLTLLGSDEPVVWHQEAQWLRIRRPSTLPSRLACAFRIEGIIDTKSSLPPHVVADSHSSSA